MRHAEREVADRMWAEVKAAVPECARRANVEMRVAGEWQFGNEQFDPGCIRLIREAAEPLSVPHRDLLSQSGHDAYDISRIASSAMIFTPCRDGISHNEAEHAELDATVPGVTEEVPVARSLRGLSLRGLDISLTPSLQFPQLPAGRGVSETFPWN